MGQAQVSLFFKSRGDKNHVQAAPSRKAAAIFARRSPTTALVMNCTGPARFPGGRRDRSGPGACVSGAHLAFSGLNPADAGPGLVCGVIGPPEMAFHLAQEVQHGPGFLHPFGRLSMGSTFYRSAGSTIILKNQASQANV